MPAPERLMRELRPHVADPRVLAAMASVPRERFVPPELQAEAWENIPLPIGSGQTISQPLVVARMCELLELRGGETVLDVGTGSGYHAAVLARLAAHVYSIELHERLSRAAAANLAAAGVGNVTLTVGDGRRGLPEHAPFAAINVAAAAGGALPPALADQLADGGRLVAPVENGEQRLVVAHRTPAGVTLRRLERVRFVPLVSRPG
ncbi:MAG TPA: protein-L-isoaspartate(D-aspartate) O-methyltransferase [Solirubrobacteraceae bacterium]|nr:protein-L-isoaspartate(D-aspartate) O-methyltransferase [Solirubrobacteraceae bacterium]